MISDELAGRLEVQLIRAREELEASSQSLLSIHSAMHSLIEALELLANGRGTPDQVVSARPSPPHPRTPAPLHPLLLLLLQKEQRQRYQAVQVMPDELQQLLQALQIRALMMRPSQIGSAEEENLQELRRLIEQALGVSRSLASSLRPPPEGEGLQPSLQWLARTMQDLYDLKVQLHIEGDLYLADENWQALVVQVARELLVNVARHAGVHEARLSVHGREDKVVIHVADSGAGFDADALLGRPVGSEASKANSLRAIRDGLALSGGALEIDSAPGRGAAITASLPRHPEETQRKETGARRDDVR